MATVAVSWRAANGCGDVARGDNLLLVWVSVAIVRGFKGHLTGTLMPDRNWILARHRDVQKRLGERLKVDPKGDQFGDPQGGLCGALQGCFSNQSVNVEGDHSVLIDSVGSFAVIQKVSKDDQLWT